MEKNVGCRPNNVCEEDMVGLFLIESGLLILSSVILMFLLAHLSRWFIGELIVSHAPVSVVRRPQFQTYSSLNPPGISKPNFSWSHYG